METPPAPTGWTQAPDYTRMSNFEPIYSVVNNFADSFNMPKASAWLLAALLSCITLSFGVLMIGGGLTVAIGTLVLAMVVGVFLGLIPSWMIFMVIVAGLGIWSLAGKRA